MKPLLSFRSLHLVLTAQCNLNCGYCYQTAPKNQNMNWATLRASIDFALSSKAREMDLMFTGGEPLLEWGKIVKAVHYAEKNIPAGRQINFAITTNGTLIDKKVRAFLDRHQFFIHLSFDGVREAQDFRRESTYAAMNVLLDKLRNEHADMFENRLRVCITLLPPTVSCLTESVRYLIGKGIREITVSPCLTPCLGHSKDSRKGLDRQFSRILRISADLFKRTGRVPFLAFRKDKNEEFPRQKNIPMCGIVHAEGLLIDVDGSVCGCPLLAGSYQDFPSDFLRQRVNALKMGDFRDPGFENRLKGFPEAARKAEIFHHKEKKYSSYRKCGECEYLDQCVVCPVSIGYDPENTDPHRVPDFICAFNMAKLKYRKQFPPMPDPAEMLEAIIAQTPRHPRAGN